jgi:hypothetical protein
LQQVHFLFNGTIFFTAPYDYQCINFLFSFLLGFGSNRLPQNHEQDGQRPGDRSHLEDDEEDLRRTIFEDNPAVEDQLEDLERQEQENLQMALMASIQEQPEGNV